MWRRSSRQARWKRAWKPSFRLSQQNLARDAYASSGGPVEGASVWGACVRISLCRVGGNGEIVRWPVSAAVGTFILGNVLRAFCVPWSTIWPAWSGKAPSWCCSSKLEAISLSGWHPQLWRWPVSGSVGLPNSFACNDLQLNFYDRHTHCYTGPGIDGDCHRCAHNVQLGGYLRMARRLIPIQKFPLFGSLGHLP